MEQGLRSSVCPLLYNKKMKIFTYLALAAMTLVSCSTRVAFTTDSSVQPTDVGVLKHQEWMVVGGEDDPLIAYRGPVTFVPVGKGLRGSEPAFDFRHDARYREHEVSFAYPAASGMQARTVRFVPEQTAEVVFSRTRGILIRPRHAGSLVAPRAESRMCTE